MLSRIYPYLFILFLSFSTFSAEETIDNFAVDTEMILFNEECAEGECVKQVIEQYEAVHKLAQDNHCLPPEDASEDDILKYYEETILNESCIQYLRKLKELEDHLKMIESELVTHAQGEEVRCDPKRVSNDGLISEDLVAATGSTSELQCTEEKKAAIKNECMADAQCALKSNLVSLGGSMFLSREDGESRDDMVKRYLGEGCSAGDDNCFYQLASGFKAAALAFLEGSWELIKMAGTGIKNGVVSAWNGLWGVEDETSTDALALAEASEDDGVLSMILANPGEALGNMWDGLVSMLTEWMANDVFCQKWEGQAHESECLEPAESWRCLSCKSIFNGGCHLVGAALAEVVPAFLTGGAVSAIRWGGKAGVTLARTLKMSEKTREAIKGSRLAQATTRAANKALDFSGANKLIGHSGKLLSESLTLVRRFMVSPMRVAASKSLSALGELGKRVGTYSFVQNGVRFISYGGKGLKTIGKVLITPVDNPLTRLAFDFGMKIGPPKIVGGARAASGAAKVAGSLDNADDPFIRMKLAEEKLINLNLERAKGIFPDQNVFDQNLTLYKNARDEYLQNIRRMRGEASSTLLNSEEKVSLTNILDEFFPELRYGDDLSKTLSNKNILDAEVELRSLLTKIEDPQRKAQLIQEFHHLRSAAFRRKRHIDNQRFFTPQEVHFNARLSPKQRLHKGLELAEIDITKVRGEEFIRLERGIDNAHAVGQARGAGVYEYSPAEIARKYRILRESGFTKDQASNLVRSGIAGDIPDFSQFNNFSDDLLKGLVSAAEGKAGARSYEDFLTNNRKTLNELLAKEKITLVDLAPDNFSSFVSLEDGKSYAILRNNRKENFIFKSNGDRLGFFSRARSQTLDDFIGGKSHSFKNADGEVFVYSRFYDGDSPRLRKTTSKPPVNHKEYDAWKSEVIAKYPVNDPNLMDQFEAFVSQRRSELLDLFKQGKLLPDEVRPNNMHLVFEPESNKKVILFYNDLDDHITDSLAFTLNQNEKINGSSHLRLGQLSGEKPGSKFIFDDGRMLSIAADPSGLPIITKTDGVATRGSLRESKFFDEIDAAAQSSLSPEGLKGYRRFMQIHAANIEEAIVRQQFGVMDIAPQTFRTFKGSDGKDYAIFFTNNIEDSLVFRLDSVAEIGNRPYARFGEHIDRFGHDFILSDGSILRSWREGGVLKHTFTSKETRDLRFLSDELHRKFDIVDSNGSRLNGDFLDFVRTNEDFLKQAVRGRLLNLSHVEPSQFVKLTSDNGQEFVTFINQGDINKSIFFPLNKTLLVAEEARDGFISFDRLRDFGSSFEDGARASFKIVDESKQFFSLRLARFHHYSDLYKTSNVLKKSNLDFIERLAIIEKMSKNGLGFQNFDQKAKDALFQALKVGEKRGASVFNYTAKEIREVKTILGNGGINPLETEILIRSGLAARPPNRFAETASGVFAKDFITMSRKTFSEKFEDLEKTLQQPSVINRNYTATEARNIRDNIESLFFIDNRHSAVELRNIVLGEGSLSKSRLYERYNDTGSNAFQNFQKTNKWLLEEKPEISMETFRRIQSNFMQEGVENIKEKYLGQFRDGGVIGNVTSKTPIDEVTLNTIRSNAYTDFKVLRELDDGFKTGEIIYPNVPHVKDSALARIQDTHPEVVQDIRFLKGIEAERQVILKKMKDVKNLDVDLNLQLSSMFEKRVELKNIRVKSPKDIEDLRLLEEEIKVLSQRVENIENEIKDVLANLTGELNRKNKRAESINTKALQQRLVDGLTSERIDWFNRMRAELGPINSPEKLEYFTDLVAEFQRDLVSIHPFGNGNGRSTRQFALYYPLMKEGFPPPRILDPDTDIFKPLDVWQQELKDGIFASQRLMDDVTEKARLGLALEDSVELLRPMGDYQVQRPMYRKGKTPWVEGPEVTSVDRRQFNHYVKEVLKEDPDLLKDIAADPHETWDNIHRLAEERYKKNNIYYDYRGKAGQNRIEELSLGMPDDDFKNLFGRATFENPEAYEFKMRNWYEDEVNWRGLATRNSAGVRSQEGILDMFRVLDKHMTSNNILRTVQGNDPNAIRKVAIDNMESYQRAARVDGDGDIGDISQWHADAVNPHYGNSIGYSTSKQEKVGEAFAMGAMQVGEYRTMPGEKIADYLKPENQARVFQRLNVGVRRSIKDVDFMRLKPLRNDFSYNYFRQQEVMGIGAAEPDAIMIVKELDAQRNVIRSYVRNPERPYEVWVVDGNAVEGVRPVEGTFRTIDLRQSRSPATP
ncbi:MAG: Fic family protein [Bacteriovoracaceae bacterium]|nr:Fic family protein [Bacteriovoracaceae bacterium]